MTDVWRMMPASQHPDPNVRQAEDIAMVLKTLMEDLNAKKITSKTMAHTYQSFCVDQLRKAEKRGQQNYKQRVKDHINDMIERRSKMNDPQSAEIMGLKQAWGLVHELPIEERK